MCLWWQMVKSLRTSDNIASIPSVRLVEKKSSLYATHGFCQIYFGRNSTVVKIMFYQSVHENQLSKYYVAKNHYLSLHFLRLLHNTVDFDTFQLDLMHYHTAMVPNTANTILATQNSFNLLSSSLNSLDHRTSSGLKTLLKSKKEIMEYWLNC